jgi:hypothetical protein
VRGGRPSLRPTQPVRRHAIDLRLLGHDLAEVGSFDWWVMWREVMRLVSYLMTCTFHWTRESDGEGAGESP